MRVKQLRNGDCGKLQDQLAKYVSDNIGKLTSADNWQDIIKDNKEIQRFLKNLLGITKEEDMKRFYQILNNAIGPIIGEEKRRQTIQKITGALSVFSIAGIALLVTGIVALPVGLSIAGAGVIGAGASFIIGTNFAKKNNITKENFRDFNDNKLPKLLEEIEGREKREGHNKGEEKKTIEKPQEPSMTVSNPDEIASLFGRINYACETNNIEFLTGFLTELEEKGIDLNKDDRLKSALITACNGGYVKIVELLLTKGTNIINTQDESGRTPLHIGCEKGDAGMVKLLLEKNSNIIDVKALHIACMKGNVEVVRMLLEKNVNIINAVDPVFGDTALHKACKEGRIGVVKFLLEQKAEINLMNNYGQTPLDIACTYDSYLYEEAINLFDRDSIMAALKQERDGDGNTFVHIMCRDYCLGNLFLGKKLMHIICSDKLGNEDILNLLNIKNKRGITPIKIGTRNESLLNLIKNAYGERALANSKRKFVSKIEEGRQKDINSLKDIVIK